VIGRNQDAEVFYVREWVEVVPDTEWRPKGLVRARFNKGLASPRFFDESMYRKFLEGEPCYIIRLSDISIQSGGLIVTGGANFVKSQPGNLEGTIPLGQVAPDNLKQLSLSQITPPLAWYVCGGSHAAPPGKGRKDGVYAADNLVLPDSTFLLEDIVFEFLPTAKGQGAGMQGAGQAVVIAPVAGDFIIEMYSGPTDGTTFDLLELSGTRQETMASLYDPLTGTYRYVYTRANLNTDFFAADLSLSFPSDRLEDISHWKFLLYHFDGTLSPPVELRPHAWEDGTTDNEDWFPLIRPF